MTTHDYYCNVVNFLVDSAVSRSKYWYPFKRAILTTLIKRKLKTSLGY